MLVGVGALGALLCVSVCVCLLGWLVGSATVQLTQQTAR